MSKIDTDVAHYNFDARQPILVISGRDVAQRVCYQMVTCYPTSAYKLRHLYKLMTVATSGGHRTSVLERHQCCRRTITKTWRAITAVYGNSLTETSHSRLTRFYRAACNATNGIAVAILSVRPSVCPSDACIVTKLNDALRIFLYHTKRQSL